MKFTKAGLALFIGVLMIWCGFLALMLPESVGIQKPILTVASFAFAGIALVVFAVLVRREVVRRRADSHRG